MNKKTKQKEDKALNEMAELLGFSGKMTTNKDGEVVGIVGGIGYDKLPEWLKKSIEKDHDEILNNKK